MISSELSAGFAGLSGHTALKPGDFGRTALNGSEHFRSVSARRGVVVMLESLTAGAARAIEAAEERARHRGSPFVEIEDLLAALVEDGESRAALLMLEYGLDREAFSHSMALGEGVQCGEPGERPPHSYALRAVLLAAYERTRLMGRMGEVGTERLLEALLSAGGPLAERVEGFGLRVSGVLEVLQREHAESTAPIPMAPDMAPLELTVPGDGPDMARILDAAGNRAREGLRVIEDYVRFVLNDPLLVRRLKDCRHRLSTALRGLDGDGQLIGARDTPGDVGTYIMTATERARENPRAVLMANFKRLGEALRTLEEYTKLVDPWLSGRFEVLRYDSYTLEKLVLTAVAARRQLGEARLYFLAGGQATLKELAWLVGEALAGGVQVVQLREKGLTDRELVARAREVRILTAKAGAVFVMNDRPDLARVVGADGVHLGQADLSVRDARRILGPNALIGVSTHDVSQLEKAVLDGAGYAGVGPVFGSQTKEFERLAGLTFVRAAADAAGIPWFAIGGIDLENLEEVLNAGARRVAIGAAIRDADRPREAARAFRSRLDVAG